VQGLGGQGQAAAIETPGLIVAAQPGQKGAQVGRGDFADVNLADVLDPDFQVLGVADQGGGAAPFGGFVLQEAGDGFFGLQSRRSVVHLEILRNGGFVKPQNVGPTKYRRPMVSGIVQVAGVGFEPTTSGL